MTAPSLARWWTGARTLVRTARAWTRQQHVPAVVSWRLWSRDPAVRVHHWAAARADPVHPVLGWAALATAASLWPLRSARMIRELTPVLGPPVAVESGKSIRRQALEQLRLAWAHGIAPHAYYTYGLYRDERRGQSLRFLYDSESGILLRALNLPSRGESLRDKVGFADRLRARAVPVLETVAWTERGELRFALGAGPLLPPTDLFFKAAAGFGGAGAMRWEHIGGGLYRSDSAPAELARLGVVIPGGDAPVLHERGLRELLRHLSRTTAMMVQRREVNHPDLADLSSGALLGLRILTGAIDGEARFLRAVFKMPVGRSVVINYGIVAPVDAETGILGAAVPFGPGGERFTHHPDTGAPIQGRTVPEWLRVRELAVRAHEAFPEYTFVGWDLAVTPEGPKLVEGNSGWGAEALQKAHGVPLLEGAFEEICLARIRQLRRR